jgi:general secretion pathway protein M
MISTSLTLPEGKAGQALALAIPLLAAALLWLAVLSPLLSWYEERDAWLAQQREIAAHMAALGQEIPALRQAVTTADQLAAGDQVLVSGNTDAIAGANLQSALQNLATQAGTSLGSTDALPVQPVGALRRIGLQVSVTATWPQLIALLEAIDTAQPRMIVDVLSITSMEQPGAAQDAPLQVSFSVTGFRGGPP